MNDAHTAPQAAAARRRSDRELAKVGMTASLGLLVATGFSRTRAARRLHVLAGVALVGCSVWHHMLYAAPADRPGRRNEAP